MPDSDPVAWISGEDKRMGEAILKAQLQFDDFLSALQNNQEIESSLLKYMYRGTKEGVECEHLFVSDLFFDDGRLCGHIDSDPQYTDEVKSGDRVEIEYHRVSDWLYVINGTGTGGFTFRVMWDNFSEEERSLYQDYPPFCWILKEKKSRGWLPRLWGKRDST